jgi:hypothetical protein
MKVCGCYNRRHGKAVKEFWVLRSLYNRCVMLLRGFGPYGVVFVNVVVINLPWHYC